MPSTFEEMVIPSESFGMVRLEKQPREETSSNPVVNTKAMEFKISTASLFT